MKIFLCNDFVNQSDGFNKNFHIKIDNEIETWDSSEDYRGLPAFTLSIIDHDTKRHLGQYSLDMCELEIFARSIIANIEAMKFYKKPFIDEKIKTDDCL
jgi:hypothetical protein